MKEKLQKSTETLEFSSPITLKQLESHLIQIYPEILSILSSCLWAVNEVYVDEDVELKDWDQVALIPPVSGG